MKNIFYFMKIGFKVFRNVLLIFYINNVSIFITSDIKCSLGSASGMSGRGDLLSAVKAQALAQVCWHHTLLHRVHTLFSTSNSMTFHDFQ